jgi:hypothetical protein
MHESSKMRLIQVYKIEFKVKSICIKWERLLQIHIGTKIHISNLRGITTFFLVVYFVDDNGIKSNYINS